MLERNRNGVYRAIDILKGEQPASRRTPNNIEMTTIHGHCCTIEPINGSDRVVVDVLGKGRIIADNRQAVDTLVLHRRWEQVEANVPARKDLRTFDNRLEMFRHKCENAVLPDKTLPDSCVHVHVLRVRNDMVFVVRHRVNGVLLNYGIVPDEATCREYSKKTLDIINEEISKRNGKH